MVVERLMHLDDPMPGPRLELAIAQLDGGLGFVFNDVWFRKDGMTLSVEAVSPKRQGEVTEDLANELLRSAQTSFLRLRAASAAFDHLAAQSATTVAVIDDYGMGTVIVCRLDGDRLIWE